MGNEESRSDFIVRVFKEAFKSEMDGHIFYAHAAELTSDDFGKGVFNRLAAEELMHLDAIRSIAESLEKDGGWMNYKDALKAATTEKRDSSVFPKDNELMEKLKEDQSDMKAVSIAIENEERAVSFYTDLLKDAETPEERVFLTEILEMEKVHLKLLRWEYESLLKNGFWGDFMEFSVEKELG
jgi:rubrerythrin